MMRGMRGDVCICEAGGGIEKAYIDLFFFLFWGVGSIGICFVFACFFCHLVFGVLHLPLVWV